VVSALGNGLGRSLRKTAYVVAACAAAALLPGSAAAQVAAPIAEGGHPGPLATSPSSVTRIACAARCGSGGAVRPGSLLRVRGKAMNRADRVLFLGKAGTEDDVAATTVVRRKTSVDVRVPLGAADGPVAIVDRDGAFSAPSPVAVALEPPPPRATPSVEYAVRSPRAYYDAEQPAALTYILHAPAPAPVAIELVRVSDGVVITRWDQPAVEPGVVQRVEWNGLAGGKVQRSGRYTFRVSVAGAAAASQTLGPQPDPATFTFARDQFPILGPHKFGTGSASFGGGRGHQGHDIFAKCGTPLVAAHGGVVKYAGYHFRAGHYLVIDNEGTGSDYAYMHLREKPLVKKGERVHTGQPIGFVGASGVAHGCHLHFEHWTAPGWYSGGSPIDPLPALKSWR
jgi:murein DD-endopeptidase MepM/ murein hydrolase activator NlpD